jgi:catechol 2,3-dioxygenase-like lactoylglutathione lyase family enzyme
MITGLSHTTIYTTDQDRSLQFYTQVLGLEVRSDSVLDGFRWLTVGGPGQRDLSILLAYPAPPMFSEEDAATIRALIAKGVLGGGVFNTDDCRASYEALKQKGVTFLQEPADRPYGVEAVFRDDSGNWFSLTQSKWAASQEWAAGESGSDQTWTGEG